MEIPSSPFANRWPKTAFCAVALLASVCLAVAAISVLQDRRGAGTLLEWIGPLFFTACAWRFAGWLWMYTARRHAPWSYEYLRIWWRMTDRGNHSPGG